MVQACLEPVQADRYPGEQCRRVRAGRPGGDDRGGVGPADRPQSEDRVPGLQIRAAGDGGAGQGGDREHGLGGGDAQQFAGRAVACRRTAHRRRDHPVLEVGGRDLCDAGDQGEHGGAGADAHAAGGVSAGADDRRQRRAGADRSRNAAVPMGHMGDAWDVAHAVLFLASDEARFITATEIVVDGGSTATGA